MNIKELVNYLFEKYKKDKEFASFVKETDLINRLIQASRRKSRDAIKTPEKLTEDINSAIPEGKNEKTGITIRNSDGFSKIIYEDLKKKRALVENQISQEYLLNIEEIRECFIYLTKNFNNVQLHQGKKWVIEYTGGL